MCVVTRAQLIWPDGQRLPRVDEVVRLVDAAGAEVTRAQVLHVFGIAGGVLDVELDYPAEGPTVLTAPFPA